ncbi:MAG: hypothetical protein C4B58_04805 [Deltaproteobacteria bacterium]|nr:MAG: hypothetical protein C4B58_04805 [Deltaproteobacteria bacterium]
MNDLLHPATQDYKWKIPLLIHKIQAILISLQLDIEGLSETITTKPNCENYVLQILSDDSRFEFLKELIRKLEVCKESIDDEGSKAKTCEVLNEIRKVLGFVEAVETSRPLSAHGFIDKAKEIFGAQGIEEFCRNFIEKVKRSMDALSKSD